MPVGANTSNGELQSKGLQNTPTAKTVQLNAAITWLFGAPATGGTMV
jgi:hypothetical protein